MSSHHDDDAALRAVNEDARCYNCGVTHSQSVRCETIRNLVRPAGPPSAIDMAAELNSIYYAALAGRTALGVSKMADLIKLYSGRPSSKFYIIGSEFGEILTGDVTFRRVVGAFLAQNPTLKPCCTYDEELDRLNVNLIQ
jgi:hypothetical protein